jgi:hypothetical protein
MYTRATDVLWAALVILTLAFWAFLIWQMVNL